MSVTVGVNGRSVVHKGSGGTSIVFPDICKTPSPAGPIPVPYPNIASSTDTAQGTKKVKVDGYPVCVRDSTFSLSSGDEAGSAGGGVASNKIKGKAEFVSCSMNVRFEGKYVCRAFDLMLHNDRNTPPMPVLQPPVPVSAKEEHPRCLICGKVL